MLVFRFSPVVLFSLFVLESGAGAADLSIADTLFHQKDYFQAVTEYKRFLFFHSGKNDSLAMQAWFQMGLCYRNSREWESARSAFDTVRMFSDSGGLGERVRFQSALVQLAQGSIGEAEFEFAGLAKFSPDSLVRSKALFFRGICQIKRYSWEEARNSFQMYAIQSQGAIPQRLDSLLREALRFRWKSPETAKWLSTALPGLGQTYAGSPLEGLYSLTLNASSVWLLVYFLTQGQIVDGLLASILLERFYFGNREKASQLAAKFDEEFSHSMAGDLLEEVRTGFGREK